jgi:hypothetical protein
MMLGPPEPTNLRDAIQVETHRCIAYSEEEPEEVRRLAQLPNRTLGTATRVHTTWHAIDTVIREPSARHARPSPGARANAEAVAKRAQKLEEAGRYKIDRRDYGTALRHMKQVHERDTRRIARILNISKPCAPAGTRHSCRGGTMQNRTAQDPPGRFSANWP